MITLATRIGDITIEDLAGMIPFMFVILLVIGLVCFAIIKKKDMENESLPIREDNARIIDMQRVDSNSIAIVTWTLFETTDGNRLRLSGKANNNYVIGDKGLLKWQGTRLVSFERNKTYVPNRAPMGKSEIKCPYCGSKQKADQTFCFSCGSKMRG